MFNWFELQNFSTQIYKNWHFGELKYFTNSWPSAWNLQSVFSTQFLGLSTMEKFKITLEQFFLTVGQNNYGNKIPLVYICWITDQSYINKFMKIYSYLSHSIQAYVWGCSLLSVSSPNIYLWRSLKMLWVLKYIRIHISKIFSESSYSILYI